jgi:cytochrome P450 family 4
VRKSEFLGLSVLLIFFQYWAYIFVRGSLIPLKIQYKGWYCTVLIAYAVTAAVKRWNQRRAWIEALEKLPGPSLKGSHPWLAHMKPFVDTFGTVPGYPGIARAFDILMNHVKTYQKEGLCRFWFFNPWRVPLFARVSVFIYDPELIQQLLTNKTNASKLIKEPRSYKIARALLEDSFLALPDTPRWKHQRKLTARGMHHQFLQHVHDVVVDLLHEKVFPSMDKDTKTSDDSVIVTKNVSDWTTRMVSEVLGLVAFSRSFGGLDDDDDDDDDIKQGEDESLFETFRTLMTILARRSLRLPFLQPFQFAETKVFNRCSNIIDTMISDIVTERVAEYNKESRTAKDAHGPSDTQQKNHKQQHKDLLSYLIEDEHDEYKLTNQELLGNARMFLFAGQDTTAIGLSFALYELASHPETQARLQKELDTLFAHDNSEQRPTYADIMALEYLDAVVKESLRLHAPALVARFNLSEITLKKGTVEYKIPKHTRLFFLPSQTGRGHGSQEQQQQYYKMDDFRPERFLKDSHTTTKDTAEAYWVPFSIGPRDCVGKPLAMTELKVFLAYILHRYTVHKTAHFTEPIKLLLVTVKPHELLLDFKLRHPGN